MSIERGLDRGRLERGSRITKQHSGSRALFMTGNPKRLEELFRIRIAINEGPEKSRANNTVSLGT